MKILNLKNVMSVLTCLALTLAVAAPSVTYAGDKGKHKGWSKPFKGSEKAKHRGWTVFHEKHVGGSEPQGEAWEVTVVDHAVQVGQQLLLQVNSLITVQELMDTAAGGSAPEGVFMRDCIVTSRMNTCTTTDTDGPLDPSLTLEASTVENGELLYLMK